MKKLTSMSPIAALAMAFVMSSSGATELQTTGCGSRGYIVDFVAAKNGERIITGMVRAKGGIPVKVTTGDVQSYMQSAAESSASAAPETEMAEILGGLSLDLAIDASGSQMQATVALQTIDMWHEFRTDDGAMLLPTITLNKKDGAASLEGGRGLTSIQLGDAVVDLKVRCDAAIDMAMSDR